MLWLVLLVITLGFAYRWYKIRRILQVARQIKCDIKAYPLLGHAYLFSGDGESRMRTFERLGREAIKNGGLTNMWLGDNYFTVVVDPVDLEVILKSSLEKDDVMRFARNLIGNGTIFAPVTIWRPRRKVLAPTFSPKNLNNFVRIFSRQSSVLAEQLQTEADSGPFSVWKYLTSYTMDSVCETALGVNVNAQKTEDEPFLKAFEKCSILIAERMVQPWLYADAVYKLLPHHETFEKSKRIICDFIDKIIKSKRITIKENKDRVNKNSSESKTFLELLIEGSGGDRGYSDLELQEETLVLALAGTDTSAVGASFTVSMLARYPAVQEQVYKELVEVFGDSDRPVTAEDLPQLKYLDAVVRESLRLYPPVPVVVRKIEKDLELPSGITLVQGCGVLVHIWGTQRNPRYWGDDAEQFRPERFLDAPLQHPAAFMAFSHGPRNCLGYQYAMMSMKTAVATLIRKYRVSIPGAHMNGSRKEQKPIRITFDVMMKDADRFTVQLESRGKKEGKFR
ncbi:cytochrome P450 4V2 [Spodoptera frugiperda]|uniref:Cytochrome P450 4V2 n=1 Tax=Spodoptera frugiperda TaxID=7108 RepID=A0A9R0EZK9_SPOFR|nr:cytochrome P450 4V2 [Spodoptera frugiperda]